MPITGPTTDASANFLSSNLTNSTGQSSSYFANTFNAAAKSGINEQKNTEADGDIKAGDSAGSAISDSADAASKLCGATKACSGRKESIPETRLKGGNVAAVEGGEVLEGDSLTYDASCKSNCGDGIGEGRGQVR
jgi:hypothetical protein